MSFGRKNAKEEEEQRELGTKRREKQCPGGFWMERSSKRSPFFIKEKEHVVLICVRKDQNLISVMEILN
jgi:hypothetical protein